MCGVVNQPLKSAVREICMRRSCGSRRWVTASGDPVPGWVTSRGDPATSRWMTIFPSVNTRLDRPRHEISFNSALAL